MIREIKIKKGQESNKLILIKELTIGLNELFETVKDKNATGLKQLFGGNDMIVSKRSFKARLIIEFDD